jgi:glycosyltransferase involved in cell wall biosynthesis
MFQIFMSLSGDSCIMNTLAAGKPRVAHVNWSDQIGGAARSAGRLVAEINREGEYQADFIVGHATQKSSIPILSNGASAVGRLRTRIDRLPLNFYPQRLAAPWSVNWVPNPYGLSKALRAYSLVHLHWIGSGAMNANIIPQLSRPCVWTLHDLWPATGGCHINYNCERLATGCGACPLLLSSCEHDLSARSARLKRATYKNSRITFIAPSRWMADRAMSAPALKDSNILVIRNGIDTRVFIPTDRTEARSRLGLDPEVFLILFGAVNGISDPNKGYDLLLDALHYIGATVRSREVQVVVFGSHMSGVGRLHQLKATYFDQITDETKLAMLYSACDVTIVPSRLESFGQVALESIACGTPVVCFGGSGLSETVHHKRTGYIARQYDVVDLAQGVLWWSRLSDQVTATRAICTLDARTRFDISGVVAEYSNVYAQLLDGPA